LGSAGACADARADPFVAGRRPSVFRRVISARLGRDWAIRGISAAPSTI
jgi:hypothetical protein